MAGDGHPTNFESLFTAERLMRWFACARAGLAQGHPGIAVGICSHCATPLVVSSKTTIVLPCPSCGHRQEGVSEDLLVDQWTEPWARVEGGSLDLEYRLAVTDLDKSSPVGCPQCGTPTPPKDAGALCGRCGATAWIVRRDERLQLGVRVDGTRHGRPFRAFVPIVTGEHMLRGDTVTGRAASSGSSLLTWSGIGCAAAIALSVLGGIGVWAAVYFSK